jgi:endoglucanase
VPEIGKNMRRLLLYLLAQLCLGGTLTGAVAQDAAKLSPPPRNNWSAGLQQGPNGPIPIIVIDQFGYPAKASKVAVIRDPKAGYDSAAHFTPGNAYTVEEQSTGQIVKKGAPIAWNGGATDELSGDKVWWFDFSDVADPGTYAIVDLERGVRSPGFRIGDDVYREVLKHALRMYFYQRAGFAKSADTAGAAWADGASHLGRWQDPQSRPWLAKQIADARDPAVRDLRGGWFDAGDYNKYTAWAARNVIVLLRAFDENQAAFGDDSGIAGSGNGVPDVLDEVKWGLDWLIRMQNADGSLFCVQGLSQGSPPSATSGPSYYGPPTTAATLMGAAAFAYASKIYAARPEPELAAFAGELEARANRAWLWASANPGTLYYNNDEARRPGSGGLAAGQQEMNDEQRLAAKFEAAVYLYELTGGAGYRSFIEANYAAIIADSGPRAWDADKQEALLYYTRLPAISPQVKDDILTAFAARVRSHEDQFRMVQAGKDPYRAPIKEYFWGSNATKALQARLYQLLAAYSGSADAGAADAAAMEYVHYIHGVNPLGLVYLTNMERAGAAHSATAMFHYWFAHGTHWEKVSAATPGPPPGYLVGGPNPHYSKDKCCGAGFGTAGFLCNWSRAYLLCRNGYAPPLGQPALKSYLQFNEGWPANSWEITEPSIGYQAQYIRVLARYVR